MNAWSYPVTLLNSREKQLDKAGIEPQSSYSFVPPANILSITIRYSDGTQAKSGKDVD